MPLTEVDVKANADNESDASYAIEQEVGDSVVLGSKRHNKSEQCQ